MLARSILTFVHVLTLVRRTLVRLTLARVLTFERTNVQFGSPNVRRKMLTLVQIFGAHVRTLANCTNVSRSGISDLRPYRRACGSIRILKNPKKHKNREKELVNPRPAVQFYHWNIPPDFSYFCRKRDKNEMGGAVGEMCGVGEM